MSNQFMLFHTYDVTLQPPNQPSKHTEACVIIHTYNAKDVFKLLKSHDKELILDHYVEMWKQSTLQGAQEAEELESSLRRGP